MLFLEKPPTKNCLQKPSPNHRFTTPRLTKKSILYNEKGKNKRCGHSIVILGIFTYVLHPAQYSRSYMSVEYFDQRLGAAHSKRWSKESFSAFFVLKSFKKARHLQQNFAKNTFFKFASKRWSTAFHW